MGFRKERSCLGRFLRAVISFFVIMILIAVAVSNDKESTGKPKATAQPVKIAATNAPTSIPATQEPAPEPTKTIEELKALLREAQDKQIPTEAPTKQPFDVEATKTMLSVMLADSYSYYNISGDETGFIISVSSEGLGDALYLAKISQNADLLKTWDETKKSFVYVYHNVKDYLATSGMENPVLMMNVVNDRNHDDIVLSVYEGQVIFDAVTTK